MRRYSLEERFSRWLKKANPDPDWALNYLLDQGISSLEPSQDPVPQIEQFAKTLLDTKMDRWLVDHLQLAWRAKKNRKEGKRRPASYALSTLAKAHLKKLAKDKRKPLNHTLEMIIEDYAADEKKLKQAIKEAKDKVDGDTKALRDQLSELSESYAKLSSEHIQLKREVGATFLKNRLKQQSGEFKKEEQVVDIDAVEEQQSIVLQDPEQGVLEGLIDQPEIEEEVMEDVPEFHHDGLVEPTNHHTSPETLTQCDVQEQESTPTRPQAKDIIFEHETTSDEKQHLLPKDVK